MRKTVLVAMLACCVGFAVATMTAHAYTRLNAWRSHGENFQLGYVVGYIDAVKLSKFKDTRAMIPTSGRSRHRDWLNSVNAFYDDPANADRPIPDAMQVVGQALQAEMLKAFKERRNRAHKNAAGTAGTAPAPAPDPVPGSAAE